MVFLRGAIVEYNGETVPDGFRKRSDIPTLEQINDNLAQTPITVGGETLSTIDDKLNFLLEGKVDLLEHGKPYAEYTNHISLTEGHDYIIFAFAQEYANTDNFSISGINVAYESPKLHVAFTANRGAFGKYYIGTATSSTITINNTGQSTYYPCIFAIDLTQ